MNDESSRRLFIAAGNVRSALTQLKLFLALPALNDRDNAGIIQAFEFTFEAIWKLLQKIAVQQGLVAPSPRKALSCGYILELCVEEDVWLKMLEDGNLTSHTYNARLAADIVARIRDSYASALLETLANCDKFLANENL